MTNAKTAIFAFIFALATLSSSLAMDYSNYTGTDWHLKVVGFTSNAGNYNVNLNYSHEDGFYLEIHTSDEFSGIWRLWKVIPHPPANEFYITFKLWTYAPNIDLDQGNSGNAEGEDIANDGPNIFSFLYYGKGETTLDNPGFNPDSYSWFPLNGDACHAHIECNYLGPKDDYIYCLSESVYKGWLKDGPSLTGSTGINRYDLEPITQQEWHTVTMHINIGECMHDNLTLVIMGADVMPNREYTWRIKDIKVYSESNVSNFTYYLPLKNIFYENNKSYLSEPPYCGDGKKQTPNSEGINEECDGTDGVPPGFRCTSDCKLEPICGDGLIVDGEKCDGTNVTEGFRCSSDCKSMTPICGDNMTVAGELCDGSDTPEGFRCSSDCKSMTPICGDGKIVGSEECDDALPVKEGFKCINCHLVRDLGPGSELADLIAKEMEKLGNGDSNIVEYKSDEAWKLTIQDLEGYLKAKGYNQNISLCSADICGSEYVSLDLSAGSNFVRIVNKNGTYYIGIKESPGAIGLNTNWAVIGLGLLVILIFGIVIVIVIAIVAYKLIKERQKKRSRIRLGGGYV